MEEESNLPPTKHRKSLDLKKCYVCQDESFGKKETGKKLLEVTFLSEFNFALFFSYIDTSNISIFLS